MISCKCCACSCSEVFRVTGLCLLNNFFIVPRRCLNHPDNFCYMCDELIFNSEAKFYSAHEEMIWALFGCQVGDQDKSSVPNVCCVTCVRILTGWINGSRQMQLAVPMVWREPKDHSSDCYFYLPDKTQMICKSKQTVKHPDLSSAMRPVRYSEELPVPKPPENLTFNDDNPDSDGHGQQEGANVDRDPTFQASYSSSKPHLWKQGYPQLHCTWF